MRVVTTSSPGQFEQYGHRWLEGRGNWPRGTQFIYYTEGFSVPNCLAKDFDEIPQFTDWLIQHIGYVPPSWRFDVVRFSHKVFAAWDAFTDYDGIGVWLDSDCQTYRSIPDGFVEAQIGDADLALYQRTGYYSETGLWIMRCRGMQEFLQTWIDYYLSNRFKRLSEWTDCLTLDSTVRRYDGKIKVKNLSGEHARHMHPQAKSELGKYIDHCKGPRKAKGYSPENEHRQATSLAEQGASL